MFVAEFQRVAGSQRSLLHALIQIRPQLRQLVVVFPAEGPCPDAFRRGGLDVEVLEAPAPLLLFQGAFDSRGRGAKVWITIRYGLPYWLRVRSLLRRRKLDLLHCNTHRAVLIAGMGGRLARRPVVWHLRGRLHPNRLIRTAGELISQRILVVSTILLEELSPRGQAKATVVPNAIDDTCLLPGPPHPSTAGRGVPGFGSQTPFRIGILATVIPYKGLHHAIRAMSLLSCLEPTRQAVLLLAGDSPDDSYRQYLDELIETLGLSTVRFLGYIDSPASLYTELDLVVVSSVERERLEYRSGEILVRGTEGLPRTILEAMYVGKPVLSTDVAGVRDQVQHERTGLLVPPGDDQAMAAAVARLINDDELRDRLAQEGARHVREAFSTTVMVARILETYQELIRVPVRRRVPGGPGAIGHGRIAITATNGTGPGRSGRTEPKPPT